MIQKYYKRVKYEIEILNNVAGQKYYDAAGPSVVQVSPSSKMTGSYLGTTGNIENFSISNSVNQIDTTRLSTKI